MAILKSAYGLTESPRLSYLEAVDRLKGTPLRELAVSRSTFVAGGSRGERCLEDGWAILCLRVDDGLLLGDLSDPRVIALRKQIDGLFTIKEWKEVTAEKPVQFLGVEVTRDSSGFHDDVSRYIKEIKVEKLQVKVFWDLVKSHYTASYATPVASAANDAAHAVRSLQLGSEGDKGNLCRLQGGSETASEVCGRS